MLLGNIIGKSGTNFFTFLVKGNAKKFMYVKALHSEGYSVLAQVVEIEKEKDETKAKCNILGYRDKSGILRNLRTPLEPNLDVEYADDDFVRNLLDLKETTNGAFIGVLQDREKIKVYLDLNRILTKHICILAKSGAGKSFLTGVLLEEILEKKVPIVVIDPHGEYSSLKYPSEKKEQLKNFGLEPKGYIKQIQEYSPDIEKNPQAKPLKLNAKSLTGDELMHLLPAKLSSSQIGLLYGALSDTTKAADFDQLMFSLQAEENNAKWTLISVIDYLKKLNIFSEQNTKLNELVSVGKCSVINLRGIPQELQEILVYKLVADLFNARKRGEIPPFFLVLEEAHNYSPERSFGEVKSSAILRQVIAEGRKFGLGCAIISQRPARVEKTILSQCSTQAILKITNPNDLKSITNSVEGITSETENEIVNLHIGTAMIVGVVDMPLFVEIRPRKTKHGGESIDVIGTFSDAKMESGVNYDFEGKVSTGSKEVVSMIRPKLMKQDIHNLVNKKIKKLSSLLVPGYMISCMKDKAPFNLLVNLNNGELVTDIERCIGKPIAFDVDKLSEKENLIFTVCTKISGNFTAADVFPKSGLQFSAVFDTLNGLLKKNILIKEGNNFSFSESMQALLDLKSFSCYEKNEFISFEVDEKLKVNYKINDVVEMLKRFVDVTSFKECNMVKYDVEY